MLPGSRNTSDAVNYLGSPFAGVLGRIASAIISFCSRGYPGDPLAAAHITPNFFKFCGKSQLTPVSNASVPLIAVFGIHRAHARAEPLQRVRNCEARKPLHALVAELARDA